MILSKRLISIGLLMMLAFYHGQVEALTLDLQGVDIKEAIKLLAESNHLNVIINPNLKGNVTFSFKGSNSLHALDQLLNFYGLARWQQGDISMVDTQAAIMAKQMSKQKWDEFLDNSQPLVRWTYHIKYGKAPEVAQILQNDTHALLSKWGRVWVDQRTNTLIVAELEKFIPNVQTLIHQLDRPVQQILIEARLVSIDSDYEQALGVQFLSLKPFGNQLLASASRDARESTFSGVARLMNHALLDVKLSALEKEGHAELISHPSLFTQNQQSASIEAGEEVPYQEVSESGGTGVMFKKAVLSLKVTPQLLPERKMLLQLTINQDRPSSKMVLGVPTISTRQISTNVMVKSGETIVLGGIYESNRESGNEGLPIISRVPLVGRLFKQRNVRFDKRQLLIFITPTVIT